MDTIERRIAQVERETLLRLADKAEREGARVLLTADGTHFATSRSNPTMLHRISVDSCDCRGFLVWNRCGHHALLLAHLGLIPDVDPEPEPALTLVIAPPVCAPCRGRGWVYVTHDDDSWPVKTTCSRCAGQPAHADGLDRWGHVLVEEPAGDVNEFGVFIADAA